MAKWSLFLGVSKSGKPVSYPYVVDTESVIGYFRLGSLSELYSCQLLSPLLLTSDCTDKRRRSGGGYDELWWFIAERTLVSSEPTEEFGVNGIVRKGL